MDPREEDPERLSREARGNMIGVLRNSCALEHRETSIRIAVEEVVLSLKRSIEERDAKLLVLPRVLPALKVE